MGHPRKFISLSIRVVIIRSRLSVRIIQGRPNESTVRLGFQLGTSSLWEVSRLCFFVVVSVGVAATMRYVCGIGRMEKMTSFKERRCLQGNHAPKANIGPTMLLEALQVGLDGYLGRYRAMTSLCSLQPLKTT